MDIWTIGAAIVSSSGLTLGAARYLAKGWVDTQFAKELQSHQHELDEKLDRAKSQIDATFRKQVEEYLGERAAERKYRFDARKRLYEAVGPLRFQLVIACADYSGRIDRIGRGEQRYDMAIGGYFGRSTAYRLLRILALTELIERQVAYADFSVDPSIAHLLAFKKAAFLCLSSQQISLKHPAEDWSAQVEHVYYDSLTTIASALIVSEAPASRPMRPPEFADLVSSPEGIEAIQPIPALLEGFQVEAKPILWLRFASLAVLCNALVRQAGPRLGISPGRLNLREMLLAARDRHIRTHLDQYMEMLEGLSAPLDHGRKGQTRLLGNLQAE